MILEQLKKYWPLIALVLISLLASVALSFGTFGIGGILAHMMPFFMGFFMCTFGMLKIFNINKFANNFAKYDLLAAKFKTYGYLYPFIELGLGLSFFALANPIITCSITAAIALFGTLGIFNAARKGLNIECPCMGQILKAPVSYVTMTENLSMALMSALMIQCAILGSLANPITAIPVAAAILLLGTFIVCKKFVFPAAIQTVEAIGKINYFFAKEKNATDLTNPPKTLPSCHKQQNGQDSDDTGAGTAEKPKQSCCSGK